VYGGALLVGAVAHLSDLLAHGARPHAPFAPFAPYWLGLFGLFGLFVAVTAPWSARDSRRGVRAPASSSRRSHPAA
jgi:hypothetical protein